MTEISRNKKFLRNLLMNERRKLVFIRVGPLGQHCIGYLPTYLKLV